MAATSQPEWKLQLQQNLSKKNGTDSPRKVVIISKSQANSGGSGSSTTSARPSSSTTNATAVKQVASSTSGNAATPSKSAFTAAKTATLVQNNNSRSTSSSSKTTTQNGVRSATHLKANNSAFKSGTTTSKQSGVNGERTSASASKAKNVSLEWSQADERLRQLRSKYDKSKAAAKTPDASATSVSNKDTAAKKTSGISAQHPSVAKVSLAAAGGMHKSSSDGALSSTFLKSASPSAGAKTAPTSPAMSSHVSHQSKVVPSASASKEQVEQPRNVAATIIGKNTDSAATPAVSSSSTSGGGGGRGASTSSALRKSIKSHPAPRPPGTSTTKATGTSPVHKKADSPKLVSKTMSKDVSGGKIEGKRTSSPTSGRTVVINTRSKGQAPKAPGNTSKDVTQKGVPDNKKTTESPKLSNKSSSGSSSTSSPKSTRGIFNKLSKSHAAPKAPKTDIQKSPAAAAATPPTISISESPTVENSSGERNVVIITKHKNKLGYDDIEDAGRTPPTRRRKNSLPASALINLSTAGPIQEASGKPPADPKVIAKEMPPSDPPAAKSKDINKNSEFVKPTASVSAGNSSPTPKKHERKVVVMRTMPSKEKDNVSTAAIPYPEDFRRPKSWLEKDTSTADDLSSESTKPTNKPSRSDSETKEPKKPTTSSKSEVVEEPELASLSSIPNASLAPIPNAPVAALNPRARSPVPNSDPLTPLQISNQVKLRNTSSGREGGEDVAPKDYSGKASDDLMRRARELKKPKKPRVTYEIVGGGVKTGRPSSLKKSKNRKPKLQVR